MAYHHRKLIQESINVSTSDLCPSFCSPENDSGFCPTPCLSLCSSICQYSLSALTSPPPSNHHPDKFHKYFPFLVVTLAVLAASFFLVCHYAIYVRFYSRRRSESQPQIQADDFDQTAHDEFLEEDHGPELDHPIWYIRTIGLQQSVINAIKICKYRKGEGLVEGIDCSVCLSEFEEDEVLRLLPKCNHAFHVPCIDTWLRSHTTCPMCRAGIVVNTAVVLSAPSPEINVDDLNNSDVNQTRNPVNFGESRTERENESESSKEGEDARGRGRGINRIRRSVSVDSAPVSMNDIPIGYEIDPENPPNVAYARLLRRRPEVNSMKRSLSCTGRKFLLSARNRNSLLPL